MASIIDICNDALALIGEEANVSAIDPPDGTKQASYCARFYPKTRDAVLERHPWSFAIKRGGLALRTGDVLDAWEFAYQKPADCVRPMFLYPANELIYLGDYKDADKYPFVVEGDAVRANLENAQLAYIYRVTDPSKYTPGFAEALVYFLAAPLAGALVKGKDGRALAKDMLKEAEFRLGKAAAVDANSANYRPDHIPNHIAQRGNSVLPGRRASVWGK